MLNFPPNPQDRQIYPYPPRPGVNTFVYNEERGIWNRIPVNSASAPNVSTSTSSPVIIYAAVAPAERPDSSALRNGDQWFDTANSDLYYYYDLAPGDQWVKVSP